MVLLDEFFWAGLDLAGFIWATSCYGQLTGGERWAGLARASLSVQ